MSKISIGVITSPHGVKGAVKVRPFTAELSLFSPKTSFYNEQENPVKITSVLVRGEKNVVVFLEGILDRDQAESLKGVQLFIDKAILPPLDINEFYYTDLVGLKVFDEQGKEIGQVENVLNYGASDILEIETLEGTLCSIAFVKDAVLEISLENKTMVIVKAMLV